MSFSKEYMLNNAISSRAKEKRRMNKRLNKIGVMFIMLAVVVMIFATTALANTVTEEIIINKTYPGSNDVILNSHTYVSFSATVLPATATDKTVNWISTDPNVLQLRAGSANPSTAAVFDVKGPGATTIIAMSKAGADTVIETYQVNVVDTTITAGRYVASVELFTDSTLSNPITNKEILDDYYRKSSGDDSFSIVLRAKYSDGTSLTYNEIAQLFTFYSTNSSKIYFEGFTPDSNPLNVGRAIAHFSVEDVNVQSASSLLYTYIYDGYNRVGLQFTRNVVAPLTLAKQATVSGDGLSATYQFTQVPSLINSSSQLVKSASNFAASDFKVQYESAPNVFEDDTHKTVTNVEWNSSSKSLVFTFNEKLDAGFDYQVVPKAGTNGINYGFLAGASYVYIDHSAEPSWLSFSAPGNVTASNIEIIPSAQSVYSSTDNNRIMYATTGISGIFTITAKSDLAPSAQFNITNLGTLPSGILFYSTGDGKTATLYTSKNLAAGTYYIDVRAQYIGDMSVYVDKRLELRVGAQGTFSVSTITLTKSTSTIPVIQTSSPVPAVNADTLAATYKFYGGASVDKIVQSVISLDGTKTPYTETFENATLTETMKNQLASSAGLVLPYKIGTQTGGTLGKLDLGTYIMRVELFAGETSIGITEVRFSVDTSFEMFDIKYSSGAGIRVEKPNATATDLPLQTLTYNATTGKYQTSGGDGVDRRSANQYQETVKTAPGDTLFFQVAVDGFNVGDRIKFYIDDFVFGANKGGGLTAQTVEVQETGSGYAFVKIPFTISDTTYLGTHVVQIKMAKTLDGTDTYDHAINLKYDLESEYLTTEVEIYDELKNATGKREIKIDSDLHITRTLFIPEDRILTLVTGNTLTIDPLRHVTVYGEIRMADNALNAGGNLVVTGKVALEDTSLDPAVEARYYYYASTDASDNPHLLITDGSNVTMNGTLVDGYTNMLTGSATMKTATITRYNFVTGAVSVPDALIDLVTIDANDSFILAQDGSQVTLDSGNSLTLVEGAKLTVGKDSQFINEGVLTTNRASVTSNGDLITRFNTGTAQLIFSDVSAEPYISSDTDDRNNETTQFFLGGATPADTAVYDSGARTLPYSISNGAVAISGTDYSNFDYKIFGNVHMYKDLNIRVGQELLIEQDSLLWIRSDGVASSTGYTLKLDGELHNKGALWVDGRAYGDGKYIEYLDSVLAGDGSIELNGAENVLGVITGDVKLQKNSSGGYIITIPENGTANIVANFKMNSNDDLIVAAGATLTVNSGVTFEVDGRVAIEPSKIDGGFSYSSGTFTNNGTTTFGFENTGNASATLMFFSNLGTMNGTFGVKSSNALNALTIPNAAVSWHPTNVGNDGISPNCAIVLTGSNNTFSTAGNWDLSYRVSEGVYASKNITFTGTGDTTIILTGAVGTSLVSTMDSPTTSADISKQTAKISNISFSGIKFYGGSASYLFDVRNGASSSDLSFKNCEFSTFGSTILSFGKTALGTDNVTGFEVANCVFSGTGIWTNKLTNSSITGNTFNNIPNNGFGINLSFQGLKNSSGTDLYISGIELKDNDFTGVTGGTNTTGIYLGGEAGTYIGEVEISGSTFTELTTGVNVVTPIVTTKTNDQITLKDLLITTSTFTDCDTAIFAVNADEKVSTGANAPNALTPNNLLGTITYVKCTTKVRDDNNVFTFLVTSEQTLNDALSMSISNISMANSFAISGSVNIANKNLTVPSGMTLTVNSSATLRTSGTAQVNVIGTIANNGVLNVGGTSFGGTGRVNTLTTGRVDGTKPITMTTETVGGTSVRGTIDGIFFGDVTVQKNTSTGTFAIGVKEDGYATANANYTLPVGSKLVGGTTTGGDSEFYISGSSTITVLGEVVEQYNHNSLHGNGTLSFAPGSKLTRTIPAGSPAPPANTIQASIVIGDGGYLEFDRDITSTRLNRKGDNDAGYSYILASGKMTVNADSTSTSIPYLVDENNSLQVSTGANITVPSDNTFIASTNGLVFANQTGYGTLIGVDRNSNANLYLNSSFGSITGPDASVTPPTTYVWAVDKWASIATVAGQDATPAGIGAAFAGGAETVYFEPTTSTTTGDLSVPAGRNLVIAEGEKLVVSAGHTLYINGDVKLETNANITGAAGSKMEIATGKSVVLNGVTYGAGDYVWDTTDSVWVNNVYDQQSLTAALKNTTVKVSRATQSFDVTVATTVPNGYEIRVDNTFSLRVKENITFTVATGGKVTDTDGVNALTGATHTSRLVVQTGAEMVLNNSATGTLTPGVNYAWNTVQSADKWTASASTAAELKKYLDAAEEVIAVANFSITNGTTVGTNLYIPDGITLSVPSGGTLYVDSKDGSTNDLVKINTGLNAGKIIGVNTSSKLTVTGTTATHIGYGEEVGSYAWVGSGATAKWMKVVSTWKEVDDAPATDDIYFNPSLANTPVTSAATPIEANVTIATGKTITISSGVKLTITGDITLEGSARIIGSDSSSELSLTTGTYPNLTSGRNYAWYSNAWYRLYNVNGLGTSVPYGSIAIVDGGDLAADTSVAGTLVIQKGDTLTIPATTTLEVTGYLVDGQVMSANITSRLRLSRTYTPQTGTALGAGWYIGGTATGSWAKTQAVAVHVGANTNSYFESSTATIVGSFDIYSDTNAGGYYTGANVGTLHIAPSPGTEMVLNGTISIFDSTDGINQIKIYDDNATSANANTGTYLQADNPDMKLKGYNENAQIVIYDVLHQITATYKWDPPTAKWTVSP